MSVEKIVTGTLAERDAKINANFETLDTGKLGKTETAAAAAKLTTSAGSTTQPVYFDGGVPKACTYGLNKTVPADAVFTDTVYTLPTASASVLGGVKIGSNVNIASGVISVNDASTTAKGVVQLSDSLNDTSVTLAASAHVVNVLYQQVNLKAPLASPALTGTPTAPTAAASTNNTQIATTAFVQSLVNSKIAAADAMIYKGTIGTGGTVTELPTTHSTGWTYKVITAGTYAGQTCEVGDMIICLNDGTAAANADWTVIQTNIDGAVVGPASAVSGRIATFDGATGKAIKDSGFTIATSVPANAKFTDTTYNPVTTTANGLMLATDKTKLDGIEVGANNYTLPAATTAVMGGVKIGANITNNGGTIAVTKDNVVAALGYTPPTSATTVTKTEFTASSANWGTLSNGYYPFTLAASGKHFLGMYRTNGSTYESVMVDVVESGSNIIIQSTEKFAGFVLTI